MRKSSRAVLPALVLVLVMASPTLASERGSYAEQARGGVDVEELQRLIERQVEDLGPVIETQVQPLVELQMDRILEDLGPMMEDIHIEVQESMQQNMVDLHEILRESLEGIDWDRTRVRVERYESREDRIREEIEVLQKRMEKLRKQLEKMDESL